MTDAELRAWQEARAECSWSERPNRPCIDCPAAWAALERSAGRCNGEPGQDGPDAAAVAVERVRRCPWCSGPVPPERDVRARFCSTLHATAAAAAVRTQRRLQAV